MAIRQWSNALKLLKESKIQPRLLYPDKYQLRVSIEKRHYQIHNTFISHELSLTEFLENVFLQNTGVNQESGRKRIQK